jgi:hypothetical protein
MTMQDAIALHGPRQLNNCLYACGMADQLKQVIAFCSRRYNENRDSRNSLAKAHLEIKNRIKDFQLSSADPG